MDILDEPMTSKEANQQVKNMRRLMIQGILETPKDMELATFVKTFIKQWSKKHATVYVANGDVQTPAGARRSLGDITRICQYYYPKEEISLERVKNILKPLVKEGLIATDICETIDKRVFFDRTGSNRRNDIQEVDDRDEYGWRFNLDKRTREPGDPPRKKKLSSKITETKRASAKR